MLGRMSSFACAARRSRARPRPARPHRGISYPLSIVMVYVTPWFEMLCGKRRVSEWSVESDLVCGCSTAVPSTATPSTATPRCFIWIDHTWKNIGAQQGCLERVFCGCSTVVPSTVAPSAVVPSTAAPSTTTPSIATASPTHTPRPAPTSTPTTFAPTTGAPTASLPPTGYPTLIPSALPTAQPTPRCVHRVAASAHSNCALSLALHARVRRLCFVLAWMGLAITALSCVQPNNSSTTR